MSTDTPVQKDEPNASAEQQSAPVQPVSEEPVAPVTETAATDTDAQPSPAPETETVTPPRRQNRSPAKPSPVQEEKAVSAPKAAKVSKSPAPEAQPQTSSFASRSFRRARLRRPTGPDSFLGSSNPCRLLWDGSCARCHNLGVGLFGVAASGLPSPGALSGLPLVLERLKPHPRHRQPVFGGVYPRRAADRRAGADQRLPGPAPAHRLRPVRALPDPLRHWACSPGHRQRQAHGLRFRPGAPDRLRLYGVAPDFQAATCCSRPSSPLPASVCTVDGSRHSPP